MTIKLDPISLIVLLMITRVAEVHFKMWLGQAQNIYCPRDTGQFSKGR